MGEMYTVDPNTVVFDDKYVVFNPMHSKLEYEATKQSINMLGQLEPVLMLNGKCIDGRHRTKITKDLGIMLLCTDVDETMSEAEIIALCNKNVMSGRDYDNTQKAIQALMLVNHYGIKAVDASRMMKIDKRMVSYASTIKGFNRQDILDVLLNSKDAKIKLDSMERPSRSLELIAKFVKAESEKELVVIHDEERVKWNPDAMIKTESGKAWFYQTLEDIKLIGQIKLEMLLTEMANMKYKTDEIVNQEK